MIILLDTSNTTLFILGIHYDAIILEDSFGEVRSKFSCSDEPEILSMALDLAKQANSRFYLRFSITALYAIYFDIIFSILLIIHY